MKIAAYALSAALFGLMSATSASALPSKAVGTAVQSEGIVLVQHGPDRRYGKKHDRRYGKEHRRHNYRPGGRYSKAPPGWRRHYKRPSYWQTRGCVVVGPVWFCP